MGACSHQDEGDTRLGGICQYTGRQGCHPEGPKHTGGMGQQVPYEMQQGQMQSPDHRKEETLATTQTGHLLAGEQLYGKGPGSHGIEQGEHEPAMHCDREG